MKTINIIALFMLCSIPMSQAIETKQEKIQTLREKINQQELVIQSLKAELLALDAEAEDVLRITITPKNLQINKKPISTEELEKRLKVLPKNLKINIISDPSTDHKKVISLLKILSDKGSYTIVFSIFDDKGTTKTPTKSNQ